MYLGASRTLKAELPADPNNRPPTIHGLRWSREAEVKTLVVLQFQFFEQCTFLNSLNVFWLLFRLPSEPFALFWNAQSSRLSNTSHLYE